MDKVQNGAQEIPFAWKMNCYLILCFFLILMCKHLFNCLVFHLIMQRILTKMCGKKIKIKKEQGVLKPLHNQLSEYFHSNIWVSLMQNELCFFFLPISDTSGIKIYRYRKTSIIIKFIWRLNLLPLKAVLSISLLISV